MTKPLLQFIRIKQTFSFLILDYKLKFALCVFASVHLLTVVPQSHLCTR